MKNIALVLCLSIGVSPLVSAADGAKNLPALPEGVRAAAAPASGLSLRGMGVFYGLDQLDLTVPEHLRLAEARADGAAQAADNPEATLPDMVQAVEDLGRLKAAFAGLQPVRAAALEAAYQRALARQPGMLSQARALEKAESLAETFMIASTDPENFKVMLQDMQELAKTHGQDERVRRPMAEVVERVMERAYRTQDIVQAWRLVEAAEGLAASSKDLRLQGLAYALVNREEAHAKNEDYKARLRESAARISEAAGGKMIIPYVPPVPGKIALKSKSTVPFAASAKAWFAKVSAKLKAGWAGLARLSQAPPAEIKHWLLQLKGGAKDNPLSTFLGLALIAGSVVGQAFSHLWAPAIGILTLLILDIHRKAFEYANDENLTAAWFQSALLSGLFFAVGFTLPVVGPFALAGLIGTSVVIRTVANWSMSKENRVTMQGFWYNVLIAGLSYFLLAGIPLIRDFYRL